MQRYLLHLCTFSDAGPVQEVSLSGGKILLALPQRQKMCTDAEKKHLQRSILCTIWVPNFAIFGACVYCCLWAKTVVEFNL